MTEPREETVDEQKAERGRDVSCLPTLTEPLDFVCIASSSACTNHVVDCETLYGWRTLCSKEIVTPEACEYDPDLRICERCRLHLTPDQQKWVRMQLEGAPE